MRTLWDNPAMKLQVPFVQLPLRYDAARLLEEVERLGEEVWRPHPQGYAGNSALPLIAVNGDPSSDSISGPMRPTAHLEACPYLRQVMASLGAIWGRSRLMRLSGHAEVPKHADLAYYWRDRVRVHVPIQTQPSVRFQCGDAEVNMAAGECWIFDTWSPHRVINANPAQRIHLVADTVGGEQFWEHASGGRVPGHPAPGWQARLVAPDPASDPQLVYESENLGSVMTPWELREHLNFIVSEAAPAPQLATIHQVCQRFNAIWLGLWARYGTSEQGWADYRAALEPFAAAIESLGSNLLLRNGMRFIGAFRAMIVQAALNDDPRGAASAPVICQGPRGIPAGAAREPSAPAASIVNSTKIATVKVAHRVRNPRFAFMLCSFLPLGRCPRRHREASRRRDARARDPCPEPSDRSFLLRSLSAPPRIFGHVSPPFQTSRRQAILDAVAPPWHHAGRSGVARWSIHARIMEGSHGGAMGLPLR